MTFRLIDSGWSGELSAARDAHHDALRIASPFIKRGAVEKLLVGGRPSSIHVITRFNLEEFAAGVSDLSALRLLVRAGGQVRGLKHLHAKLFLFGADCAIAGSANLTDAGLGRNHEFGFAATDPAVVAAAGAYFDRLWGRTNNDLTEARIDGWDARIRAWLATGAPPVRPTGLGDESEDGGLPSLPEESQLAQTAGQAFVKFFGQGNNRAPLDLPVIDEVRSSGSHRAMTYPTGKRPNSVADGARMFIGCMTGAPNDTRIIGRAIGMRHVQGRDDATPTDIALRPWKTKWSHYVRVHHAQFVGGTLASGISLAELMDSLGAAAFASTQANAAIGNGNTNPRMALMRQPAVRLSAEGNAWVNARLDAAMVRHGKLSPAELSTLDWPEP